MTTKIEIDVSQLLSLTGTLDNAASLINTGVSRVLNEVADEVRDSTVTRIVSQVRLTQSYVDPRIHVASRATESKAEVVIEAPRDSVFLSRYGATQATQANVWTEAMYAEKFGSQNTLRRPSPKAPLMPWTPRTGDRSNGRSIAAGQKAAGVMAGVVRGGSDKRLQKVFFMRLRRGNRSGDTVGTFRRTDGGKTIKAVKSLSVDQISRVVWEREATEISTTLSDRVIDAVSNDIEKEFSKL